MITLESKDSTLPKKNTVKFMTTASTLKIGDKNQQELILDKQEPNA